MAVPRAPRRAIRLRRSELASRSGPVVLVLVASILSSGGAAWLILAGSSRPAGAITAIGGILLLLGGAMPKSAKTRLVAFLEPAADRAFDGLVLGAVAWSLRDREPRASAVALVALVLSYLAAYVRARGRALGYRVDEGVAPRALRYGIVSVGLGAALVEGAAWVVAALSFLTAAVRSADVARQHRS